jgi:hypothetical protein
MFARWIVLLGLFALMNAAFAQLGPTRRVCPSNDRSTECLNQNNRDTTARNQAEIDKYLEKNQANFDKQQAQRRDDQRRECLKKLGPYDSASLCPR